MTTLPVYFEQRRVGTIDVDKSGPGFTYDPNWVALRGAFPISLTMPLRSERIGPDTFLPWAANLLPESEPKGSGEESHSLWAKRGSPCPLPVCKRSSPYPSTTNVASAFQ